VADAPDDDDLQATLCLLDEAKSGNEKALELFCRRYLPPLQRWARSRLPPRPGDPVETDALVRETLHAALSRPDALEHLRASTLLTHLRQAVLDLDDGGGAGRDEASPGIARVPHESSPIEDAIGKATLHRYEQALAGLEPAEREAAIARIEMGLEYGQIALLLGEAGPDEAKSAVSAAVLRLAGTMNLEGDPR
jgi:DNA-directed RNA polymerase specialized sigma24 family protein